MPFSRMASRSEETKRAIIRAAKQLFSTRGYDAVTMREIAKEAGCSHTTIYLYFKDKEALLNQLSLGPLQELSQQLEACLRNQTLPPDERLKTLSLQFLHFALHHRTMYDVFFMARASRVDEEEAELAVQRLRNHLFGLLRRAIGECLLLKDSDQRLWDYARIYFFTLQGIIATYTTSAEPRDTLMERLSPTFALAIDVLLSGFRQTLHKEAKEHEDRKNF